MKNRIITTYLVISGLLLFVIGAAILLVPHAFHASNGIILGKDPNLLSEIRAPGGLLAGVSIFILIGAFVSKWQNTAVQLTVLVYGSFGLARLLGIVLDGMPSDGIIAATVIELVVAVLGLLITRSQSSPEITENTSNMAVVPDIK